MGSDKKLKKETMTSDDVMIAEMLLCLSEAKPTPMPTVTPPSKLKIPFEWSVRQRRSKAVSAKKPAAQRASPSTPLSYSAATSYSGVGVGGTVDGVSEDSSKSLLIAHPKRTEPARSKVNEPTTSVRRPRKKKNAAELKQEELVLVEENDQLKRQVQTLRAKIDMERSTSAYYTKRKLDLESQAENEKKRCTEWPEELRRLVLPDLNLPFVEDSSIRDNL